MQTVQKFSMLFSNKTVRHSVCLVQVSIVFWRGMILTVVVSGGCHWTVTDISCFTNFKGFHNQRGECHWPEVTGCLVLVFGTGTIIAFTKMWDLLQPRQVEDEAEDVCQLPYTVFKNLSSNAIMEKKNLTPCIKNPRKLCICMYLFPH